MNQPLIGSAPLWHSGVNCRFWDGNAETIGLFGPVRGTAGTQITLPGSDKYRSLFTTPSPTTGQILAGAANAIQLLEFDPGSSTPGAPPRWAVFAVTPTGLGSLPDTLTSPGAGRVEIPPVWAFAEQDDLVVAVRANSASDPAFAWDRSNANDFVALSGSPLGAVGVAITSRILVLLGCTSIAEPDPARYLTVRWSDKFNFEDWTPTDLNWSGELQVEGGSRIVGGGRTSYGIAVWTDKALTMLTETFDPGSVFNPDVVEGARGLLANRAWCEADGQLWWLDGTGTLNVYDGGRARTIPNQLRYVTSERITPENQARIYLQANPDYNEVLIWYPSGNAGDECDACIVYNYGNPGWYYWQLNRTAWCQRFGVIENLGIDHDNKVFRHDIDVSFGAPWRNLDPLDEAPWVLAAPGNTPAAADVTAFDFLLVSNLMTTDNPAGSSYDITRLMLDHIPSPSASSTGDQLEVTLIAYGEARLGASKKVDRKMMAQGNSLLDFRVGGKAVQLRIEGQAQKTVWRFGNIDPSAGDKR